MNEALEFITQTLLGELLVVVVGVLLAQLIRLTWDRWRFGGWKIRIEKDGKQLLEEDIPADRIKEVLSDSISLRVYVKGLTSSYAWLNCDLLTEGKQIGLFIEDRKARHFVVDLDKNPTPSLPQRTG